MLDQHRAGVAGALLDEDTVYLRRPPPRPGARLPDGRIPAEVFAWFRPDDLVWSYRVNNYLQGRDLAPFDIPAW
ncbi:hypothetical protein HBB16_10405 [Pseudonocardia sp. MCCB 268]|nr:hypothetical protein [Pseudonocardia cytotoxica]